MNWKLIGYSLACVMVPVVWGLIIVWVSNRMDRRLVRAGRRERKGKPPNPIEYHI